MELKVPAVGESITEVEIGDWLKKEGETVARDENLVVIESDKATMELPAPSAGKLTKILKQKGSVVNVGEVIAHLEESGDGKVTADKPAKPDEASPASATAAPLAANAAPRLMPAAERILNQQGIKPESVEGTGPGGRILKEDAQRKAGEKTSEKAQESHSQPAAVSTSSPAPASQTHKPAAGSRAEEVVPMTRLRRTLADRLVQAQHSAALLTTFNEVDMSSIMALRKEYQDAFVAKYGVKLGFMSFFVKAVIEGLKQIPQVNAEIRGSDVVYHNYFDIGVAVGGGRGLVVPVLRNAERLSFAEIEIAIADLGKRAKDNKLKLEELQGGTFTISNGGVYGSLLSTPIINPPQSGILGMHAIQDRPVAREGQVVIRPMMYIALTYDHRIVDGREAVTFLKRIKEMIENPTRILLEV
ncbi:MAG: 2-oxoglutarate dehydrogenase complex dihydrolipoamide succinyltransferase [Verrucomicrobiales bacterium]|jgi:2-oxoglutarate dehydrogenase E2 component (dihydrolipoamide succinyltransferase)|nr:2-oxoglutarate dehydrogenase complex dihydrolipoamide succinyltransferase [Verrucomicrobiales bacterium]